jgi:hypothetical protein
LRSRAWIGLDGRCWGSLHPRRIGKNSQALRLENESFGRLVHLGVIRRLFHKRYSLLVIGFSALYLSPSTIYRLPKALRLLLSSIKYPVSSIEYPVSSIEYPASSIQYPASSIQFPLLVTFEPWNWNRSVLSWIRQRIGCCIALQHNRSMHQKQNTYRRFYRLTFDRNGNFFAAPGSRQYRRKWYPAYKNSHRLSSRWLPPTIAFTLINPPWEIAHSGL